MSRPTRFRRLAGTVLSTLALTSLVACGGSSSTSQDDTGTPTPPPQSPAPTAVNPSTPTVVPSPTTPTPSPVSPPPSSSPTPSPTPPPSTPPLPSSPPTSSPPPASSPPPVVVSPPHVRAFPQNPVDYADVVVRAWGRGDVATLQRFAQPTVVHRLLGYANPGGNDWRRTDIEGAAGTVYVTYRNHVTGAKLVLAVTSHLAVQAKPGAVREARFS